MDKVLDVILTALEVVYGRPWIALCVLLFMFAIAGVIIVLAHRRIAPFMAASEARISALKTGLGSSGDVGAERLAFGDSYLEVSTTLASTKDGGGSLAQAWRDFSETIIDESSSPIRSTTRPIIYYRSATPRFDGLIFASNTFVAIGLILTFVGLVVALHTAGPSMAGNVEQAKGALTLLLTVASSKFLTSIGGIGASLWLRFAEDGLSRRVKRQTNQICALLERGIIHVAPQRLIAEQLDVMKEQRDQLLSFNTDVAMQLSDRIGVKFQQAIAPVTASLAVLNDNMTSMSQGLGQGAAKAIEEASGGELRALGQTLATLGEHLESLGARVGESGEDAANQIRAAGADFSRAAADIREAFERLTSEVDGVGGKLAEQSEAAAKVQGKAMERILENMQESQTRSAATMSEAVKALQAAGAEAAATLQKEVGAALAEGVAESQRTFRVALDESGEALRGAASGLAKAVADAADQIERTGAGFNRSGEHAARTAEALAEVTGEARSVASSIANAGEGFARAAAPVAQALQAISEAAGRIAGSIESGRELGSDALQGLKQLAEGIRETQSAAETAWRDYRARFEGVDKALEATATKLGETLGDSFKGFSDFARTFDTELGSAVSKLSNAQIGRAHV